MTAKTVKRHICVSCRHLFPEDEIEFGPDPWDQEMNYDDTPVWECGPCRFISWHDT